MAQAKSSRFPTPRAALRFYFRASELLADERKPGLYSAARHPGRCTHPNAVCDFLAVDSCFVGLDDFQIWLLKELYGPDGFGAPRRTMSYISEAARQKFPDQLITPRMVAHSRNDALERVEQRLRKEHLM